MAIIEYRRGEHPGGFVGYRLVVSKGQAGDVVQRYFSTLRQPNQEALRRARYWESRYQKQVYRKKYQRVLSPELALKSRDPGRVVPGLRAILRVLHRQAGPVLNPAFVVRRYVGKSQGGYHCFPVCMYGYAEAWELAVDQYLREVGGEAEFSRSQLLRARPLPELFTGPLATSRRQSGYSAKGIRAILREARAW